MSLNFNCIRLNIGNPICFYCNVKLEKGNFNELYCDELLGLQACNNHKLNALDDIRAHIKKILFFFPMQKKKQILISYLIYWVFILKSSAQVVLLMMAGILRNKLIWGLILLKLRNYGVAKQ